MSLEREEWERARKTVNLSREREKKPYYQGLKQARVAASQVTSHAGWNWFLQILSAHKEQAEAVLREMEVNQRNSLDFSPAGLAAAQASRMMWAERIRTLEQVMGIPVQILEDSERAVKILEELKRAKLQENRDDSVAS